MYEHDPPGNAVELKAWYSEGIDAIRVTSSPGGVSLDAGQARELRDELDRLIDEAEDG